MTVGLYFDLTCMHGGGGAPHLVSSWKHFASLHFNAEGMFLHVIVNTAKEIKLMTDAGGEREREREREIMGYV